jgi:hypothetical protein
LRRIVVVMMGDPFGIEEAERRLAEARTRLGQAMVRLATVRAELSIEELSLRAQLAAAEVALTDASFLGAGVDHTCPLHTTGAISCWDDNARRQLGDGTTPRHLVPTPIVDP